MDKVFTRAQIEQLRRDAQKLKKVRSLQMHEALDEVARQFGFQRWSQLMVAEKALHGTDTFKQRFGICPSSPSRCMNGSLSEVRPMQMHPSGPHLLSDVLHFPADLPLMADFIDEMAACREAYAARIRQRAIEVLGRLRVALKARGVSEGLQ